MQFSCVKGIVSVKIMGMSQEEFAGFSELLRLKGFGRPDSNSFRCIRGAEKTDFEGYFSEESFLSIREWLANNGATEKAGEPND